MHVSHSRKHAPMVISEEILDPDLNRFRVAFANRLISAAIVPEGAPSWRAGGIPLSGNFSFMGSRYFGHARSSADLGSAK